MHTSNDHCRVGTLDFEVTTLEQAVKHTLDDALSERSDHVHLANAWSIALASDDVELREVFRNGSTYPGKPVVWAMQWLRGGNGLTRPGRLRAHLLRESARGGTASTRQTYSSVARGRRLKSFNRI